MPDFGKIWVTLMIVTFMIWNHPFISLFTFILAGIISYFIGFLIRNPDIAKMMEDKWGITIDMKYFGG